MERALPEWNSHEVAYGKCHTYWALVGKSVTADFGPGVDDDLYVSCAGGWRDQNGVSSDAEYRCVAALMGHKENRPLGPVLREIAFRLARLAFAALSALLDTGRLPGETA